MAEIATGSFTHTIEEIDAGVTEVENTKGNSISLTAAVEAIAEEKAMDYFEYGELIPDNSDFDDYYNLGVYYVQNNSSADTMYNIPRNADGVANGGRLEVLQTIAPIEGVDYVKQIYLTNTDEGRIYSRRKLSNSWSSWVEYVTKPVLTSTVYSMGTSIAASESSRYNLNSATTIGRFYFGATASKYIDSLPFSVGTGGIGCELIVERIQATNRYRQTLIQNNGASNVGKFWVRMATSGTAPNLTWSSWFLFEGTQI